MIYCDYNATAPLRPEARNAMVDAMAIGANPSSVHAAGRAARKRIETAREQVAFAIGSRAEDLTFTSCGTEAIHLAINGVAAMLKQGHFIVSDLEHDAVHGALQTVTQPKTNLSLTSEGVIDLERLESVLAALSPDETPIVVLQLANNETGVIQPVAKAAALVRERRGLIICDAVQALGKIPVNTAMLGVDYLSLSAHKIGGPQGVGALWVRPDAPLKPQLLGGGQEKSRRSGTENLIGIVGFGAAAEVVTASTDSGSMSKIRDAFETSIASAAPVRFAGQRSERLPNTSCFALPGFSSETQVMAMDLAGICVSAGSACSSGKVKASKVLTAMGWPRENAGSALRVSFGWNNTMADAVATADAWIAAARRARPELMLEMA